MKPTHYVLLTPSEGKSRIILIIEAPIIKGVIDDEYAKIVARAARKSLIARSKLTKTVYTEGMFRLIPWPKK